MKEEEMNELDGQTLSDGKGTEFKKMLFDRILGKMTDGNQQRLNADCFPR